MEGRKRSLSALKNLSGMKLPAAVPLNLPFHHKALVAPHWRSSLDPVFL